MTIAAYAAVGGCALWDGSNQSVIRMKAARNPAEAARLTLVGVKSFHAGDYESAGAKFTAALESDSTYGPAHNNLGLLHFEQGRLYQAALAFEKSMELMPDDPAVYYNLGLTLESAGRVYEAIDLYQQAIEMDSSNPHFLGNLVRLRIRLGEKDKSLVQQLRDLVLIETRPEWRRWADRQLAITLNTKLDRGPDTPELQTESETSDAGNADSRVIELSNLPDVEVTDRSDDNVPLIPAPNPDHSEER